MPFRSVISLRVDDALHDRLLRSASETGLELSSYVRLALHQWLDGTVIDARSSHEQLRFLSVAMGFLLAAHPNQSPCSAVIAAWRAEMDEEASHGR